MNLVVCRHPADNFKGIFMVPDGIELDAGSLVKVETARGEFPAQCITGTFRAIPEVICPLWGTQPGKLCRVLSYLHETELEWPSKPEPVDDDEP